MSELLSLLIQLISCPSVTPNDAGCQAHISERLNKIGFKVETMQIGDVTNLWARLGDKPPLFVFAGHTDVVPPGNEASWSSPPFKAVVKENSIYGRGTTDMKGALAAMVVATEEFVKTHPAFDGSIGFLITSDEEGPSLNGTKKVIEQLQKRGEVIDYAIVGEASSLEKAGDQIRIGRRGSLHGKLSIYGKQGHVAYPDQVENPIHQSAKALHTLSHSEWDQGNDAFPPTTFQITNIQAGTGARNVVPGELDVWFNFRYSTASTVEELEQKTKNILDTSGFKYQLEWSSGAEPFLTKQGRLLDTVKNAIKNVSGLTPKLSTAGGTSDARFIAPTGAEVIELGVVSKTAHQVNEHASVQDLVLLKKYYTEILKQLLSSNK